MTTPMLYPLPVAQEVLGNLGRTSLYELIKSGDIKTVKIGARTFVTKLELEDFVKRLTEIDR